MVKWMTRLYIHYIKTIKTKYIEQMALQEYGITAPKIGIYLGDITDTMDLLYHGLVVTGFYMGN
jgi:cystathionine beta-lyase family protein involved in aluminum resistance